MKLYYLAFSARGMDLADKLADALGGETARCGAPLDLDGWTAAHFQTGAGLIYVGAAGIAVRAIAPYVRDKSLDPAVVAVDEYGHFAVPLLSGHLGGANDLARAIARSCGGVAAVTTATDAGDVFAVDAWARQQNCAVLDTEKIKSVSGRLLAGGSVRLLSAWSIEGQPPAGIEPTDGVDCDVCLDVRNTCPDALRLVPRVGVLGVGCKAGVTQAALEAALAVMLEKTGLLAEAICAVASIDLKKDEPGLLAFCSAHGWPLFTYSAAALGEVPGQFTPSEFVQAVTGVDNVCERAAVLASRGALRWKKMAGGGVTMAVALKPCRFTWRWLDG